MNMSELKLWRVWACWKHDPKYGKVPINPNTGGNAQSNNPTTWGTYEQATNAAEKYQCDGVMFALVGGICGIDIDIGVGVAIDVDGINNNPEREERETQAKEVIALMDTYTERSPSGNGYHIIFRCDLLEIPQLNGKLDPAYYMKNPHNGIEVYISGLTNRYMTYTGNVVNNRDVEDRTPQLLTILDKYMKYEKPSKPSKVSGGFSKGSVPTAQSVIILAQSAKNGKSFNDLFMCGDLRKYNGDESSGDMALCQLLAFWCGNNPSLIDEIFRKSALMREKWEREDYRASTIGKAIAQ
jgi:primase-polymerase (primpol)-like protein